MAFYIVKPWYKKSSPIITTGIYGASWNSSSTPALTRTDDAANFSDPSPVYAMANNTWSTGSSPFDNIMPWAGMRIVEDSEAGTLVEIPKFWYKWVRVSSNLKLQITADAATATANSFFCSPAHADRGDGVGERDYVYIGRYHCASDYKSKTGVTPVANYTRAQFRTSIHNLGSNVWQNDFAMWWTIRMLYLVEFAHWNSQLKIGYGGGNNSSAGTMGYTDNMPYHTGTTQLARDTYGLGTQYRYIEGLWDNVFDWVDGIRFSGTNGRNISAIKNPANFSDSTGGTGVGTRATSSGYIEAWTVPTTSGFAYALYPNNVTTSGDGTTYVCDRCYHDSSGVVLNTGGDYYQSQSYGAFNLGGNSTASSKGADMGSRLMVLPPSRLTA